MAPADLGIGRYNAWVRATNNFGRSAWSLHYNFVVTTAPTMYATPDAMNRRPALNWQPQAGAAKYEIWVSDANTPQVAVIRKITANSGTTFLPTTDLNAGTYRVWVRAVSGSGTSSPWSLPETFSIV